MLIILTNSCNREDIPLLTTTQIIYITQTTATCGGNITSDGGATIRARGVCWGTNQTPTISDNKTINGVGLGSFLSIISGLAPNTTYYERAYSTNNAGTSYGSVVLTPQIAGHNLKNKLGLIKFGNYDNNKKKIYT